MTLHLKTYLCHAFLLSIVIFFNIAELQTDFWEPKVDLIDADKVHAGYPHGGSHSENYIKSCNVLCLLSSNRMFILSWYRLPTGRPKQMPSSFNHFQQHGAFLGHPVCSCFRSKAASLKGNNWFQFQISVYCIGKYAKTCDWRHKK